MVVVLVEVVVVGEEAVEVEGVSDHTMVFFLYIMCMCNFVIKKIVHYICRPIPFQVCISCLLPTLCWAWWRLFLTSFHFLPLSLLIFTLEARLLKRKSVVFFPPLFKTWSLMLHLELTNNIINVGFSLCVTFGCKLGLVMVWSSEIIFGLTYKINLVVVVHGILTKYRCS